MKPALKPLSYAVAALSLALATGPAHANPAGAQVVAGQVDFSLVNPKVLEITNSPNSIINWQQFSIGADEITRFIQQGASSAVLNRVVGDDLSSILGQLQSNGRVFLVNPNGIVFGPGAVVDVAGLVASTLNLSDEDFLQGNYTFLNDGTGSILNQGTLQALQDILLVAPEITNEGSIYAENGSVMLAAGESVLAIDPQMLEVEFELQAPENRVLNLGEVYADGVGLFGSTVNQAGHVEVDAGGRVRLHAAGGDVLQQGTVRASGGDVRIDGDTVYLQGEISAASAGGQGGSVTVRGGRRIDATAGSRIDVTGDTGGRVLIDGKAGQVALSATIDAGGVTNGGVIDITGEQVLLLGADVRADSEAQGGAVHVGGEWQGGGDLPHAGNVVVGVGSTLSATGEKGGEISVWSTSSTGFYGAADTRGSEQGGRIELSSQGTLQWQGGDVAPVTPGSGGQLLLDPKDIIVTDSPPSSLALAMTLADGSSVGSSTTFTLTDGDELGLGVDIDGDRMAISARRDDTGPGADAGAVYLFTGVGTDYSGLKLQSKLADGSLSGALLLGNANLFGHSLSLDGDRLAVSAVQRNSSRGAVFLFNGVGTDFSGLGLVGELGSTSTGGLPNIALADGDWFGASVALNGDFLVVGAQNDDTGGTPPGADLGAVYLFNGVGTNYAGLTQRDKIADGWSDGNGFTLDLVNLDEFFGVSVDIDGDLLVIGASNDDTGGFNAGAVYLFNGVGTDFSGLTYQDTLESGWTDSNAFTLSLGANQFFGTSVALDNGLLAVGASGDSTQGSQRGAVHLFSTAGTDFSGLVFERKLVSGSNVGTTLTLTDADFFGTDVALDGDRLVVTAQWDDTGGLNRGAAYLFNGVGTDFSTLNLAGTLASGSSILGSGPFTLADLDSFGNAVALSGDLLAVGASADNAGVGAVYLFDGVGTDFSGLALRRKLANGTTLTSGTLSLGAGDQFGISVGLDNGNLAVGANGHDAGGASNSGGVYLFSGATGDFSTLALDLLLENGSLAGGPGLAASDSFGWSVALEGDLLAVGAFESGMQGSVYLFDNLNAGLANTQFELHLQDGTVGLTLGANDIFGYSVDFDADMLAVGALGDNGAMGAAYLFSGVQGANYANLALDQKLTNGVAGLTLAAGDQFGAGVSLDGGLLAIGAFGDDTGGSNRGAVHLLRGDANTYANLAFQTKIAHGLVGGVSLADSDFFGRSVALEGNLLAVGAAGSDIGGTNRGAVYLFTGLDGISSVAGATFASRPADTLYLTPLQITDILDTGSAVTLQANNDITVSSAITTNEGGAGGDFTLEAGRSILLNASITTDNGNFSATANSASANGTHRDAGAAQLVMADGTAIDAGTGTVTLTVASGDGLPDNTSGNLVATRLTGNMINLNHFGVTAGSRTLFDTNDSVFGGTEVNGVLNIGGEAEWLDGDVTVSGALNILSGGTFTVAYGGSFNLDRVTTGGIQVDTGGTLSSIGNNFLLQDVTTLGTVEVLSGFARIRDISFESGSVAEITAGGTLQLQGTVDLKAGSIVRGPTAGSPGALEFFSGVTTATVNSSSVTLGSLSTRAGPTVTLNTPVTTDSFSMLYQGQLTPTVSVNDTITVADTFRWDFGQISGIGTIDAQTATTVSLLCGAACLTTDATVPVADRWLNGATLNLPAFTFADGRTLVSIGAINMTQGSEPTIAAGAKLTMSGGAINFITGAPFPDLSERIFIDGTLLMNGGFLQPPGGYVVRNGGLMEVTSSVPVTLDSLSGVIGINTGGTFRKLAGSATTTVNARINNSGTVELLGGLVDATADGVFQQASGEFRLAGGNLTVGNAAGSNFRVTGNTFGQGILSGIGTITGQVSLEGGIIAPGGKTTTAGDQIGTLVIGELVIVDGTLDMQIAGLTAGTTYDQLNVLGPVTLGGELDITSTTYGGEAIGDLYDLILSNGTMTGAFSAVNFLTSGYSYSTSIAGGFFRATLAAFPGGGNPFGPGSTTQWNGGTVNITGNLNLEGTIEWTAGDVNISGVFDVQPGALFKVDNTSGITQTLTANAFNLAAGGSLQIIDTLVAGTLSRIDAPATINGSITMSAGQLEFVDTFTVSNGASINIANGVMTLADNFSNLGSLLFSSGTLNLQGGANSNADSLTLNGGTVNVTGGALSNSGNFNVGGGTLNLGTSFTQASGTTTISGGTVNVGTFFVNGGLFKMKNATLAGNLNVAGTATFSPGLSPGISVITGNLTLGPGSTTLIELFGTTPGTGYDQIQVGGTALLDGALNFSFGSFVPAASNVFTFLTWGSLSSGTNFQTFSNLNGGTLNLGASSYSISGIQIATAPPSAVTSTTSNSVITNNPAPGSSTTKPLGTEPYAPEASVSTTYEPEPTTSGSSGENATGEADGATQDEEQTADSSTSAGGEATASGSGDREMEICL